MYIIVCNFLVGLCDLVVIFSFTDSVLFNIHQYSGHSSAQICSPDSPDHEQKPLDEETHDYENDYLDPSLIVYEIDASQLKIMQELGSGQYGQVFAAWLSPTKNEQAAHRSTKEQIGSLVAVKSCKTNMDDISALKQFMNEALTLSQFDHDNVLRLIGVVTQEKPLRIIIEHMPYGDLRALLKGCRRNGISVTALEKVYIMKQVAAGMEHLVSKKFVHRDIAARNILLGHYCTVKIGDFGLSRQLADDVQYYIVQSRCLLPIKWMAPESLVGRVFTHATDVYSFGVFLWEVETQAKSPWKGMNTEMVVRKVGKGDRLSCPSGCPKAIYNLMKKCWKNVWGVLILNQFKKCLHIVVFLISLHLKRAHVVNFCI